MGRGKGELQGIFSILQLDFITSLEDNVKSVITFDSNNNIMKKREIKSARNSCSENIAYCGCDCDLSA